MEILKDVVEARLRQGNEDSCRRCETRSHDLVDVGRNFIQELERMMRIQDEGIGVSIA